MLIRHFSFDDACWEAWLVQSTAFSSQRFLYLWWRKWILVLLYVSWWSQNTFSGTMWEVMPTAKSPVGRSKRRLVCHQWKRWFWMWSLWKWLHVGGPVRTRHHVSYPSTKWDQRLTCQKFDVMFLCKINMELIQKRPPSPHNNKTEDSNVLIVDFKSCLWVFFTVSSSCLTPGR